MRDKDSKKKGTNKRKTMRKMIYKQEKRNSILSYINKIHCTEKIILHNLTGQVIIFHNYHIEYTKTSEFSYMKKKKVSSANANATTAATASRPCVTPTVTGQHDIKFLLHTWPRLVSEKVYLASQL